MRKLLIFAGLPLLLLTVWAIRAQENGSDAHVTIKTGEVIDVRGTVISRLGAIGAVRVGEETNYEDESFSTLRFRLPADRLEQALVELDSAGGSITDKSVSLEDGETARQHSDDLAGIEACLGDVAGSLESELPNPAADLERCRDQLAATTPARSSQAVQEAELIVDIRHVGSTGWLFFLAIIIIALALCGALLLVLRTMQEPPTPLPKAVAAEMKIPNPDTREIYLRRN